jgi:hypothetical protein
MEMVFIVVKGDRTHRQNNNFRVCSKCGKFQGNLAACGEYIG